MSNESKIRQECKIRPPLKTFVNSMMMFCLKLAIFWSKKPQFTIHSTNLTLIHLIY